MQMAVLVCSPSTWGEETEGSEVQGYPPLSRKLKASLGRCSLLGPNGNIHTVPPALKTQIIAEEPGAVLGYTCVLKPAGQLHTQNFKTAHTSPTQTQVCPRPAQRWVLSLKSQP